MISRDVSTSPIQFESQREREGALGPELNPSPTADEAHSWKVNEFFEIRQSAVGGLGAFAVKDLEYGEHILLERPLLESTTLDLLRDFETLNAVEQTIFKGLHGFYIKGGAAALYKIWNANT